MFSSNSPISPSSSFSPVCWGDKQSTNSMGTPKSPGSDVNDKSRSRKDIKGSRRRIVRACMRCRIRKTKCDGGKPCTRCTEADDVCEYMKCSKKESKEYSQDYVERLLEQNDKYKTAMRVLYANRRLSIQPDSMAIPSTDSDDVPLVHDILDRLGLLGQESDSISLVSDAPIQSQIPNASTIAPQKIWSTSSIQSSMFDTAIFETQSSTTMDTGVFSDLPMLVECGEPDLMAMDTDMGLNFPFEVYESLDITRAGEMLNQFTPDFFTSQQMSPEDMCPLNVFNEVMHGGFPSEQSWADGAANFQFSY